MDIKPIRSEQDYRETLREVSCFFDDEPEPGTPDGDRFEILLTLLEAWEAQHYPIGLPDPVEAIKFRMEQGGLTVKDIAPAIGKTSRVYEILNRKRRLTLAMIQKLHTLFGISAESLIQPQ